ncbi:MAG: hypothetical protein KC933_04790 [Myxococcales bacterium]|nr:hypothetical protein [Myxococcales bacterium]
MMVTSFAFTSVAAAQTASEVELWDATWAEYQALDAIPLEERGMVSVSQDLGVVIAGDIDDVFDIYSNVYNAMGLHPFLVGLTPIRHTGHRLDFIAYEDIPMPDGSIFHAATIARQTFDRRAHSYDAETFDVPGIITRQHITFTQIAADQVLVVEHLTFEATPEYIELAAQGGVYAHYLVQLGLQQRIEAGELQPIRFPAWLPHGHRGCPR